MDLDNLMYAILFREMEVEVDGEALVIFNVERPIVGSISLDGKVFTEYISGEKHLKLDYAFMNEIPNGFELLRPLSEVKDYAKTLQEIERNKLYVYDADSIEKGKPEFCSVDLDEFKRAYDVKFSIIYTSSLSKAIDDLVSGKITADEYYRKVYCEEESQTNSKVLNVNFNR